MAVRVEVALKPELKDGVGEGITKRVRGELGIEVESVRCVDVYAVDGLAEDELRKVAEEVFGDPIAQNAAVARPLGLDYDWLLEVSYRPGVKDNVGDTAKEALEDALGKFEGVVYSSRQFVVKGKITREEAERICRKLLANELIEEWRVVGKGEALQARVPKVELRHEPKIDEIELPRSGAKLRGLSEKRLLALSEKEMKVIRGYFEDERVKEQRRAAGIPENPTDVELETLAQTWSEHCKHKIFTAKIKYDDGNGKVRRINSLFKSYIKKATERVARKKKDFLVSVFVDNAGIIRWNEKWNLVMKVETHNAPSALDPYGGALTGIVGVNRDVLGAGLGAKPIFNTDVFCFADPYFKGEVPPPLHHPRRIFEGVRRGVQDGGNKLGIPTVNGSIVFDDRYLGRPLVYCGTGGIMPREVGGKPSHVKEIRDGHLAVMVGGRIGKDGIHGATFSSQQIDEKSPVSAVQLGDPITQKKMGDMLLEARDAGLYLAITDNGAGGLSSSIGELAQISGGCEIWLDKAPLKYAGLDPWEILVSESQERMTVALPPEKWERFAELAKRRGVEATVVGRFTASGKFVAKFGEKVVAYLDMNFLHDGVPQMKLEARYVGEKKNEPRVEVGDLAEELKKLLGRLNICSKEYVVRQYDHEVQGGSIVKPLSGAKHDGPSDAAVLRPAFDSWEGVVVAHGICPRYGDIDAYAMAQNVVDEAMRNYVASGGNPAQAAGLDNFCWPDPLAPDDVAAEPQQLVGSSRLDEEGKLGKLVQTCQGLYDACVAYGLPLISGKDSMKNDAVVGGRKLSVQPTLLVSVVGKIEDVRKAVTMDVKRAGDFVYVIGKTKKEFGGSEWFAAHGLVGDSVPRVDAKAAAKIYARLHRAISRGLLASCHDVSDGGLAVALAETAFAGDLGMKVELGGIVREGEMSDAEILFSESASRFVITVSPENAGKFEKTMKGDAVKLGEVTPVRNLMVGGVDSKIALDTSIDELKEAWQKTLKW